MNELPRETRALLDLSRDADEPTAEDRLRVKRALAASLAAGALLAAPPAAAALAATGSAVQVTGGVASGIGVTAVSTWLGVGLVTGLAASSVIAFVTTPKKGPDVAALHASSSPVAARPVTTSVVAATTTQPEAEGDPSEGASPAPATSQRMPGTPSAAHGVNRVAAPTTASIASETDLLSAAHAALGRGDARGALELLEQHEREFPDGALTEERLASKVFALCGLGRRVEAAKTAAILLRRAPASPLRARVLDSCASPR